MSTPLRVLIVEDSEDDAILLVEDLKNGGYDPVYKRVETEPEMRAALAEGTWDVVLSDSSMPRFSGMKAFEMMRGLDIPFIFVSGTIEEEKAVEAMRHGAQDYLMKGNIKRLLPAIERELREAATRRERRKAEELVERLSRLKKYLAPQVAELVLKEGGARCLESHRREITAVFIDLRGFTAFSDREEPEEVLNLLRAYHAELGKLVFKHEGTLEHFAGDGCLVFFNDPLLQQDHLERAVRMSLEIRARVVELRAAWLKKDHDLHVGIGLVSGYATLGDFGFEGRMEYGAVGNVVNLAARLSAEAKGGQILTNNKTLAKLERVATEPLGELQVRGFARPVAAFNILRALEAA